MSGSEPAPSPGEVVGDLSAAEVRVLGCLVEKEATTPASYPLTLNALRNACNQATSRDPVVELSEQEVQRALLALRDRRLARPVRGPGDRVTKFAHRLPEQLALDPAEVAALSVLMLRGPQTVGEVRTRTRRQHDFPDTTTVAAVLGELADRDPALVGEVPRAPGQKEDRWAHRLGVPDVPDEPDESADRTAAAAATTPGPGGTGKTMAAVMLAGARAVRDAVADPAVARSWGQDSVLEGQDVASLAGHLARGAVWVVGDYLDAEPPTGSADVASAGEYVAHLGELLTEDDHAAIRRRGTDVAAVGHDQLVASLRSRLEHLEGRVPDVDPDRLVAVFGGLAIRFEDYLATRVVEQVVHLDDLVRSVDGLEVAVPPAAVEVAERVGLDVLRLRHGPGAPLRVLYRRGYADLVPVL